MNAQNNGVSGTSEELARFAIDEAIRALDRQVERVDRMRTAAFGLVGFTATASAFLVGAALQSETRGPRFFVPLGFGTGLFLLAIALLWMSQRPLQNWSDRVTARVLVEDFAQSSDPLASYGHLAGFYDRAVESNGAILERLGRRLQWLSACCGALMLCWLVLIWLVAS